MTSPRIPLFQRKAGPSDAPSGSKPAITIAIGHGKPSDDSESENADREAGEDATCPNCGCVFNPDTGEVSQAPPDQSDQSGPDDGDLSSKIASMMGGGGNGQ